MSEKRYLILVLVLCLFIISAVSAEWIIPNCYYASSNNASVLNLTDSNTNSFYPTNTGGNVLFDCNFGTGIDLDDIDTVAIYNSKPSGDWIIYDVNPYGAPSATMMNVTIPTGAGWSYGYVPQPYNKWDNVNHTVITMHQSGWQWNPREIKFGRFESPNNTVPYTYPVKIIDAITNTGISNATLYAVILDKAYEFVLTDSLGMYQLDDVSGTNMVNGDTLILQGIKNGYTQYGLEVIVNDNTNGKEQVIPLYSNSQNPITGEFSVVFMPYINGTAESINVSATVFGNGYYQTKTGFTPTFQNLTAGNTYSYSISAVGYDTVVNTFTGGSGYISHITVVMYPTGTMPAPTLTPTGTATITPTPTIISGWQYNEVYVYDGSAGNSENEVFVNNVYYQIHNLDLNTWTNSSTATGIFPLQGYAYNDVMIYLQAEGFADKTVTTYIYPDLGNPIIDTVHPIYMYPDNAPAGYVSIYFTVLDGNSGAAIKSASVAITYYDDEGNLLDKSSLTSGVGSAIFMINTNTNVTAYISKSGYITASRRFSVTDEGVYTYTIYLMPLGSVTTFTTAPTTIQTTAGGGYIGEIGGNRTPTSCEISANATFIDSMMSKLACAGIRTGEAQGWALACIIICVCMLFGGRYGKGLGVAFGGSAGYVISLGMGLVPLWSFFAMLVLAGLVFAVKIWRTTSND